jgi:streptogramin lyase
VRAIALSLLFASGCQAPVPLHQLKTPLFAMGQTDAPVPTMVVGQPSAASGQLTVRFDGALAQSSQGRRIQATVADVERVVVIIKPHGAAEISQIVLKAALAGGQTSVTFSGLPPGDALVTIKAFDMAGAIIGAATKIATVIVGQIGSVDVAMQLAPTYLPPSGGGTSTSTGGLSAAISLLNGPQIYPTQSGALGMEAEVGFQPHDIGVGPDGDAWVAGGNAQAGVLVKLAPDGTLLRRLSFGSFFHGVAVDRQGHVWLTDSAPDYILTELLELDEQGNVLQRIPVDNPGAGLVTHVDADRSGGVWVSEGDGTLHYKPPGATSLTHATGRGPVTVGGAQQDYWTAGGQSFGGTATLRHYRVDGSLWHELPAGAGRVATCVAVDAAGNAWVATRREDGANVTDFETRLMTVSPAGQLLREVQVGAAEPATLHIDDAGTVAMFTKDGKLHRYTAQGAPVGETPMQSVVWDPTIGASGVWSFHMNTTDGKVFRTAF